LESQQQHATYEYGDILAGGHLSGQVIPPFTGYIDWFLPNGTLNLRLDGGIWSIPTDIALDPMRNAYFAPSLGPIRVFDSSGQFGGTFPGYTRNFGVITFDREGNAYTNAPVGMGIIAKTNPSGDLVTTFDVPLDNLPGGGSGGLVSLDLASDQCTMYYTSRGKRVFRYDVCAGVALPDLTSSLPGYWAGQLRILPDGGVLVVNLDSVLRLSNTGAVTRVYDVAGKDRWWALALDVDHSSFWATAHDTAFKFDIATGVILTSFQSPRLHLVVPDYWFTAIAVVGEPRAAAAPTPVPTLSEWSRILLILGLVAVAVIRLSASGS